MNLTSDQLAFLARFAKSPDGRTIVDILSGHLESTDRKLRAAVGEETFRQQGRAQQLAELIDMVVKAEVTLNRTKPVPSQAPRFSGL